MTRRARRWRRAPPSRHRGHRRPRRKELAVTFDAADAATAARRSADDGQRAPREPVIEDFTVDVRPREIPRQARVTRVAILRFRDLERARLRPRVLARARRGYRDPGTRREPQGFDAAIVPAASLTATTCAPARSPSSRPPRTSSAASPRRAARFSAHATFRSFARSGSCPGIVRNDPRVRCDWVRMRAGSDRTPWTRGLKGEFLRMPIAHGEAAGSPTNAPSPRSRSAAGSCSATSTIRASRRRRRTRTVRSTGSRVWRAPAGTSWVSCLIRSDQRKTYSVEGTASAFFGWFWKASASPLPQGGSRLSPSRSRDRTTGGCPPGARAGRNAPHPLRSNGGR